ncbi:MAG: metallophosphoesterase family protein [Bacillota bacterium]|jgi:putative phosphoesterase
MLLAVGDSHRSSRALALIAEIIHRHQPELFVHTGDNFSDYEFLKKQTKLSGYGVRGNCDPGLFRAPEEQIIDYCGKKILLTHGHTLGVKYSYSGILGRAKDVGADAVIFGHSHVQFAQEEDGIWLLNPGSIPLPRGGSPAGYAWLKVEAGEIQVQLVTI